MGYAIAEEAARQGADVILISGPVELQTKHPAINRIDVQTAQQMYEQVMTCFPSVDCAIMSAAVADFTPANRVDQKIKSGSDTMELVLQPTKDIAQHIGKIKKTNQVIVGFALETTDEEKHALGKIKKKNFDFIVLNSLNDKGAGFRHDTNKVTFIDNSGNKEEHALKSKKEVAVDIINKLTSIIG